MTATECEVVARLALLHYDVGASSSWTDGALQDGKALSTEAYSPFARPWYPEVPPM